MRKVLEEHRVLLRCVLKEGLRANKNYDSGLVKKRALQIRGSSWFEPSPSLIQSNAKPDLRLYREAEVVYKVSLAPLETQEISYHSRRGCCLKVF